MDRIRLVQYKSKSIIIVLAVSFVISTLLLVNIDFFELEKIRKEAGNFEYENHIHNIRGIDIEDHSDKFIFGPKSNRLGNNLVAIQEKSTKTHDVPKENLMALTGYINAGGTICTIIQTCTVSCNGQSLQEIIAAVNNLLENESICTAQYRTLELKSVTFPGNAISSGWLQDISTSINALKIQSVDLEELDNSAFSGSPFGAAGIKLSLTLTDTNIRHLSKASFNGRQISILEIKFGSMRQSITIEENLLGDTSFSVQSISINYCLSSSGAIRNLTGTGDVLAGLKTLDLSYNMISKLEADVFSKAPNLEQVYLVATGLTEIEIGAFRGLGKLIQLYINSNDLKTVSEGVFNNLDGIVSLFQDGNPWNCNCDLQWFKEYILSLPTVDYRRCKVESQWLNMEDIEFCPSNSTTSKQTTKVTPPSTKGTTISPVTIPTSTPEDTSDFIFETILCRNLLSYPFENVTDDESSFFMASVFKRRNINFTIQEIDDSSTYRIDLVGSIKSTEFLIWTNVENRADYGCVYNINSYVLMALQFQKSYTVCISSNDTTDTYAIIADDCTAISTPSEWSRRVWLNNNQKTTVILSIVLTFIVALAIASGAVYYLVRYNPELIKGSKRVLIVKRGSYSPNVLVMPSSKKEAIRHMSLCTNYEGYLTPKLKRWTKNKLSDMRYQELDTISDRSIDEGPEDKMIRMETNIDDKNGENNIYEPPPLPPNHPGRRRDSGKPYFYSNM